MESALSVGLSVDWLALREPADAEARSVALLGELSPAGPLVVHDLGSGTGSMLRWLAPRLPGPQHWTLYDRLPGLLDVARRTTTVDSSGTPVDISATARDITTLTPADLDGVSLVTASAVLDMLTTDELTAVVAACAGAGCPVLWTLTVVGEISLVPADARDSAHAAAFNAHQRRGGRLGPSASSVAARLFRRHGYAVTVRPSPWRLGAGNRALAEEWLRGWVDAAVEQDPALSGDYLAHRLTSPFEAVVGHEDLLALPPT
jgi:hypothetical protein